ncbi:MAG: HEAT repeat domain-containing protein [Chryseolinea sp.]
MEREKLETLLIDYIDGKLSPEERRMVEQEHLQRNEDTYKLYEQLKEVMQAMNRSSQLEPSMNLRSNFDRVLQNELAVNTRGKAVWFTPAFYRAAAAVALLAVAGAVGFLINEQRQHAARLAEAQAEILRTKKEMMDLLGNQNSASQRLRGATVAYNDITEAHADADIVKVLIRTMNEDENSNVRLAAIEALAKFNEQPHVRQALISALPSQKDPVVQIALIRLLVDMKAKGLQKELEQITTDDSVLPAVKDEAHAGLLKLS